MSTKTKDKTIGFQVNQAELAMLEAERDRRQAAMPGTRVALSDILRGWIHEHLAAAKVQRP